jgi:hypothetical protein
VGTLERGGPRSRWGREPSSEADPARGGREPSSEADLTRGGREPSSGANFTRGVVSPRARRTSLEGALRYATSVGCGGLYGVDRVEVSLRFAFFAGFKRDSPGYLGDPYGCPRQ